MQEGLSMSPEQNKILIRNHYEATTHKGDAEAIEEQVAPDFIDHDAPPGTPRGSEGVKKHIAAVRSAFPDIRVTIEDMIAEGDKVAVRATWRGTHQGVYMGIPPTNRQFTFTGMVFWRIENGKIAERWANIDRLSFMQQLGAIPISAQEKTEPS
jgi:steroid delta-isomerase-like uncharacterized protein